MSVAWMRMSRWMCGGKTRENNIKKNKKNECIQKHLRVISIGDKLRDSFEMVWMCLM